MTAASLPEPTDSAKLPPSETFRDEEDVFLSHPDRLDEALTVRFGDAVWDGAGVIRRRANVERHQLRVVFSVHPAWSLRSREIAMALLNPTDPRLLARSIAFGSRTYKLGHIRGRCESYKIAAAWQLERDLPDDISAWKKSEWVAMVDAEIARGCKNGTVRNLVAAVRDLVVLAPILTGGGLGTDPWNGKATKVICQSAAKGRTEVIAPESWIPLIGACWTYIDTFAADILRLRDTHQCDLRAGMPAWRHRPLISDTIRLEDYIEDRASVVPMRLHNGELVPNWFQLSRLITADRANAMFHAGRQSGRRMRETVREAIAAGDIPTEKLTSDEFETLLAQRIASKHTSGDEATMARMTNSDERLNVWIASADNRVPVVSAEACRSPERITEDDVNWPMMERIVYRSELLTGLLGKGWAAAHRRRDKILMLARAGRVFAAPKGIGSMGQYRECLGFTHIVGADGKQQPWRRSMSDYQARCELRALRAACFVYIAAMTMMRDSEIQDLKRGCLRTVYGVPAVTSHLYKGRAAKVVAHWWIVDEVATAIAVLEKLSLDEDYLFARFVDGDLEDHEPGINSGREIDFLLEHLAKTGDRSGLAPIPEGALVSPRSLRRTSASISRELGGNELAVSQQLKHAINFGYSNVTADYMAPDPAWAKLLHSNRTEENLEHMVSIIRASAHSAHPLAGRGGERLTQEMVRAADQRAAPGHASTLLSDEELAMLLKKVAPDIHFGPANACIYDEETALCRRQANTDVQGPLLGMCQPARCTNSVVGIEHLPVWIIELQTLQGTLNDNRLSQPRRQALSKRLVDVQQVLSQENKAGEQ